MQHNWTDPSARPLKLYRIIHPRSSTSYDPTQGFHSALPPAKASSLASIPQFLAAITAHRNQELLPHGGSPFISTFADLEEAESWALAVEDVFDQVAYVVEIDARSEVLKAVKIWKVQDVREECGVELGGRQGLGMGARDSEWLVLYHVPGVAIRVLKSSAEIRKERAWEDDGSFAFYAGAPTADEYEHLRYKTSELVTPIEWAAWEKCRCESQAVCNHPGPFCDPAKPQRA